MKKLKFHSGILAVIAILAVIIAAASCNKTELDAVRGIQPVSTNDIQWKQDFIDDLKSMSPAERKEAIDKFAPRLNSQLVAYLRSSGYDCNIRPITYSFGSGKAQKIQSGDGNTYDLPFTDQLYAVIKGGSCFHDSVSVFVECFNGTFRIIGDNNNQRIGSYAPVFTIEKNHGLNTYVDYKTSIWIADKWGLRLHKGKEWRDDNVITPKEALALEPQLGDIPVTVEVNPGDVVDLGNMTFNGRPPVK